MTNERPAPMTAVRAAQIGSRLLKELDQLGTTPTRCITTEEREAIRFMRDLAANATITSTRAQQAHQHRASIGRPPR